MSEADNLDTAFETLIKCLDSPIDPQQSLLTLCHKEWEAGVPIGDYFYELRSAAQEAQAPLRMACLALTSQLPPAVQNILKDWIATQDEITKPIARDFIVVVRKRLTEKGIPLDRGNRDLNPLLEVRSEECEKRPIPERVGIDHQEEGKHRDPQEYPNTEFRDSTMSEGVNAVSRRNYSRGKVPREATSMFRMRRHEALPTQVSSPILPTVWKTRASSSRLFLR